MNPHQVTRDFEKAVAEYTGAPYCVAVNSCTNALFLCLMWQQREVGYRSDITITIPKRTYVSVPMQIKHAGFDLEFEDSTWLGMYRLKPFPLWDSARLFTWNMYWKGQFICTSHHWSKTLGIQQGGCILTDDDRAQTWLRRARFDGRTEGVALKDDPIAHGLGWHMYMSPEVAAEGLVRLKFLPKHNEPLPNDDYPDLSKLEIFK